MKYKRRLRRTVSVHFTVFCVLMAFVVTVLTSFDSFPIYSVHEGSEPSSHFVPVFTDLKSFLFFDYPDPVTVDDSVSVSDLPSVHGFSVSRFGTATEMSYGSLIVYNRSGLWSDGQFCIVRVVFAGYGEFFYYKEDEEEALPFVSGDEIFLDIGESVTITNIPSSVLYSVWVVKAEEGTGSLEVPDNTGTISSSIPSEVGIYSVRDVPLLPGTDTIGFEDPADDFDKVSPASSESYFGFIISSDPSRVSYVYTFFLLFLICFCTFFHILREKYQ